MLQSTTHRKFTKGLFPFINTGLVDSVNHQIDNPTMWQMYMNSMQNQKYKNNGLMKNPYDVFTLTQSGHRKYNHDLLSGGLLGMVQAIKMGLPPSHGFMSVVSHYATDNLSNKMVRTMGVEGRNIFEALMGMASSRQRRYYRTNYQNYPKKPINPMWAMMM